MDALKRQVVSIEQAERTAREQAQAAVVDLRQEIEAARTRKRAMTRTGTDAPKFPAISQTGMASNNESSGPVSESSHTKSS